MWLKAAFQTTSESPDEICVRPEYGLSCFPGNRWDGMDISTILPHFHCCSRKQVCHRLPVEATAPVPSLFPQYCFGWHTQKQTQTLAHELTCHVDSVDQGLWDPVPDVHQTGYMDNDVDPAGRLQHAVVVCDVALNDLHLRPLCGRNRKDAKEKHKCWVMQQQHLQCVWSHDSWHVSQ